MYANGILVEEDNGNYGHLEKGRDGKWKASSSEFEEQILNRAQVLIDPSETRSLLRTAMARWMDTARPEELAKIKKLIDQSFKGLTQEENARDTSPDEEVDPGFERTENPARDRDHVKETTEMT